MALTEYPITLVVNKPHGSLPLDGTWTLTVATDKGYFTDENGDRLIGGPDIIGTVDGVANFSLPATGQTGLIPGDGQYRLSFQSKNNQYTLGPFLFPVTGPMNLNDIADVPQGTPVTPTLVQEAKDARDAAVAAKTAAETANAAAQAVGTTNDTIIAGRINASGSATQQALVAQLKPRGMLNILDYGVVTGTASSQAAAVKTALDANPGKWFYFPPGDYRFDTQLNVTQNNGLYIDGRIYANAAMDNLINWDNGLTVSNYAVAKGIVGSGVLDCDLKARRGVAVGSVIGFALGAGGLLILNPVNRGAWLKPAGAEVYLDGLRMKNTGTTNAGSTPSVTTTNGSTAITGTFLATDEGSPIVGTGIPVGTWLASVTDGTNAVLSAAATASGTITATILSNIGLEADMGDCTISHLAPRDFTVGIWDKGSNRLIDAHPWIGDPTQQAARYPISVGFIIAGNSILTSCESDSQRYKVRTARPGRAVSVTTTNGSPTVTSSAGFTNADLGSPISGPGIPAGATITAYANNSSVTISANATASATIAATIMGSAKVQLTNHKAFTLVANVPDALAAANPGVVWDLRDGARVVVQGGRYQGHGNTSDAWVSGFTSKLTITNPIDDVPGSITNFGEYKRGVRLGVTSFPGSMFGSTGGSATLTTNSCQMEVRDGFAEYHFVLIGTIPASGWSGKLRIGFSAFPAGALSQSTGRGTLSFLTSSVSPATFNNVVAVLANPLSGPGTTVMTLNTVGTGASGEPDTAAIAGAAIQIWGSLRAPFTYPSL